ncbi:type II toxin-antitoxin system YafO family toxin [Klebsiella pneumoniae]|jgi:mRNA interferase YafO|uniref:type II toxin-antitoxin system YafO family toxin n=1 Tax=Klebsiella pneumoniae complex TaxID=3390273 RepID=UPI000E2D12FB|nr:MULTISPECIES: type II toxin-antitoxin system YafO family toxin [Klebsiella]ELQ7903164.1 type II toxin-antitoxin system YafO family toxin [Klebsiella oxytoca]HCT4801057.1 type II toxin-antitoxin system YafO family toxin [Klebsiella michiganensis]MDW3810538.1 type II toxin-antitoxin system YafO family toxin [Klebsiella pneumoniae]MDW3815766.1 type II toxin-antitoxin system YafO family toxin [Klebsiella pneumoniae]NRE95027.1 type II toxin-antitoxin system YafO family toxin [Klebsiella variicol
MALIVEFNPDTRAEFLEPTFKQHPDFEEQLKAEFIYCKTNKVTTDIFGNDAIFTFPPYAVEAQLARIHIKLPNEAPWPHGLPDRQKKSNTYLVYAQHMWDPSRFSILALVTPAHDLMSAENTQLISRFSQYAEDFHSR